MTCPNLEKSSLRKVTQWQWQKIQELLERATKTKFYQQLFRKLHLKISQIKNFQDFSQIPPTTEEDLRCNPFDFIVQPNPEIWRIFTTSGTTGKPKIIFRNFIKKGSESVFLWKILLKRLHYQPKLVGVFRPAKGLAASGPVIEKMLEILKIPHFSLAIEAGEKAACEAFLLLKPDLIIGSPSFIVKIIEEIEKKQKKFFSKTKKIITTGERLFPNQRKFIEKKLKAEVFNVYGAADPSVWLASECHLHQGFHIFPYTSYLETNKNGLLVTPFANKTMILIRYQLSDKVEFDNNSCDCGITLPKIKAVISRIKETP